MTATQKAENKVRIKKYILKYTTLQLITIHSEFRDIISDVSKINTDTIATNKPLMLVPMMALCCLIINNTSS